MISLYISTQWNYIFVEYTKFKEKYLEYSTKDMKTQKKWRKKATDRSR